MFTASIGPYLYSIAGLDPSTWTIPGFLRRRDEAAAGREGRGVGVDGEIGVRVGTATAAATASATTAATTAAAATEEITMHVVPDPHAVRVLGRASARVRTMCGDVVVEWHVVSDGGGGKVFAMNATVPHNCGRARLVLHVPDADVREPFPSGSFASSSDRTTVDSTAALCADGHVYRLRVEENGEKRKGGEGRREEEEEEKEEERRGMDGTLPVLDLPRNVISARIGRGGKTVDVVVGGGRSELKLVGSVVGGKAMVLCAARMAVLARL